MLKDIISLKKYLLSLILRPRKASVLMYHSVVDDNRFFSISPVNFEKQLKFLKKKKFNVIKLSDLAKTIQNKKQIPYKTTVLSFDDGYQDNYSNVFPLLKKYNFSAMIFLITNLIGQKGYLNWAEIKEMCQSGLVEFGCHTASHPDLTKISIAELKLELQNSRRIIENQLKTSCNYFTYPKGFFNDFVVKEIKDTGYQMALTVQEGNIDFESDIFKLPRLSIDRSTTFAQFLGKISGLQFIKHKI